MYPPENFPDKWPVKAYDNREFIHSSEARAIRVQCELIEPKYRFRQYGIENTLVFFGSARTRQPKEALEQLESVKASITDPENPTEEERATLKRAEVAVKASAYYQASRDLAFELSKWSMDLPKGKRFHICSGGGPGIMEAANRGAYDAGAQSIGLNISLPFEQHSNPYIEPGLNFEFHYFFVRKYWFLYLAKALVAFPGGFGTMDELFEMLTLIQTDKAHKNLPIVLFGKEYWERLFDFEYLEEWGFISPGDMKLFSIHDDVKEARDFLIAEIERLWL